MACDFCLSETNDGTTGQMSGNQFFCLLIIVMVIGILVALLKSGK
jgi:hypothetical protein